jgi:hypothetical protein
MLYPSKTGKRVTELLLNKQSSVQKPVISNQAMCATDDSVKSVALRGCSYSTTNCLRKAIMVDDKVTCRALWNNMWSRLKKRGYYNISFLVISALIIYLEKWTQKVWEFWEVIPGHTQTWGSPQISILYTLHRIYGPFYLREGGTITGIIHLDMLKKHFAITNYPKDNHYINAIFQQDGAPPRIHANMEDF